MSQDISTIEIKLNDAKKPANLRQVSLVFSITKKCKNHSQKSWKSEWYYSMTAEF
jgi:hypothetical protein